MKTVTVEVKGVAYVMPCSFGVLKRLCDIGIDPGEQVAVYAHKNKLSLTSAQIVQVLYVGATAAGCELTEEDFGQAVMEQFYNYVPTTVGYLISLVSGGPELAIPTEGKSKKKQTTTTSK